jgi:glycosyltransferase involved in cell wall biosynthesis
MKPLVSLLIPAFNSEKWLGDCVESALAQTWPRKEIIIVDDGSQDATLRIARSYAGPNVQVATQENRGASAARNHALSLAQGDYIQWLDADDLLAPDKIARQMDGAEPGHSSRVLLSGAWGQFYHCPERTRFIRTSLWQSLDSTDWLWHRLDTGFWMAIESWLVSRRLTELAGPWDETILRDNDGEYFSRVVSCSTGTRFVPAARCFCRKGSFGSISNSLSLNNRKLDSLYSSICRHIQRLRSLEDSPRTRAACRNHLQRVASYFYPDRPDLLRQLQDLATELGGNLDLAKIRPKYRWVQGVFGLRFARRALRTRAAVETLLRRHWERLLCPHSGGHGKGYLPRITEARSGDGLSKAVSGSL